MHGDYYDEPGPDRPEAGDHRTLLAAAVAVGAWVAVCVWVWLVRGAG